VLGMLVLSIMKWVERRMPKQHRATLSLTIDSEGFSDSEVRAALRKDGLHIYSWGVTYSAPTQIRKVDCELQWHSRESSQETPAFVEQLAHHPSVATLEWKNV
jgi:hypothetical protein